MNIRILCADLTICMKCMKILKVLPLTETERDFRIFSLHVINNEMNGA